MSDVQLFQTNDGGELRLDGDLVMDDGLATSVYLSMFGGNLDDDASDATKSEQWWGNAIEGDPMRQYRSRTQHILQALPLSTGNLLRVEEAVQADLAWMVESKLATGMVVRASIPAPKTVGIDIKVEVDGKVIPFKFVKPWGD